MLDENEKQMQLMKSDLKSTKEESETCASESDSSHQFHNCHRDACNITLHTMSYSSWVTIQLLYVCMLTCSYPVYSIYSIMI